jgi:hypothetical protein
MAFGWIGSTMAFGAVVCRGPRHDKHRDVRRMRRKKALKYISSLPAIVLTFGRINVRSVRPS